LNSVCPSWNFTQSIVRVLFLVFFAYVLGIRSYLCSCLKKE
jgi:hypothetical protein